MEYTNRLYRLTRASHASPSPSRQAWINSRSFLSGTGLKSAAGIADMGVEVVHMRFVRVQYDAGDRQFKPAGFQLVSQLEDRTTYLIADLSPSDFIPVEEPELKIVMARS